MENLAEFIWTPELIAEVARDMDRGYNLLYGPDSLVWNNTDRKWVPRPAK